MTRHSSTPECRCRLEPCACAYIGSLRPGGPNARLREVALAQKSAPGPHWPACPCPRCWSARAATWTAPAALARHMTEAVR